MKAVILAGGKGSRFFPFNYYRPKVMFPVCNKPILEHILDVLCKCNISDVILVIGYRGARIKNYFGNGARVNCRIIYVEQKDPLGTADALLKAEHLIKDEWFLCIYADNLFPHEALQNLLSFWRNVKEKERVHGIVMLSKVKEPWRHSTVALKDNKIQRIAWKARKGHYPSDLALTGVFIFNQEIFPYLERASGIIQEVENGVIPPEEYDIIDSLNTLTSEGGTIYGNITEHWWIDVNYPWETFIANKLTFKEMNKKLTETYIHEEACVSDRAKIEGNVFIDKGATVEENVHIRGPVWIGKNTKVLNGSYIRGPTIIGNDCVIGPYAEVSGCIGNRVKIGHCAEVSGTILDYTWIVHYCHISGIIGERVDIGAGTIVGTLRFDDESAKVIIRGIPVNTNWLGNCAFIGDYCRTGVGAMIMPGRIIGPGSMVGPGVMVMKNIPPFKLVLRKEEVEIRDWRPEIYDK